MANRRGKLIVFEGLDRTGKTTQTQRLIQQLQSIHGDNKVKHFCFPDRSTPIGRIISEYLTNPDPEKELDAHAIHLLFTANRWELSPQIESAIISGITVIIDRYYYSGCVYTAAKRIEGLDLNWCRAPEVGLPRPDLCVFLDIEPHVAAERGGFGEERYERRDVQVRVRELYAEMRMHDDEREDMVVVDASGSVDEVELEVGRVVDERMKQFDEKPYTLRRVRPWQSESEASQ